MLQVFKVGPDKSWRLVYEPDTRQVRAILNVFGYTESIHPIAEFATSEALHERIQAEGLLLPALMQDDSLPD